MRENQEQHALPAELGGWNWGAFALTWIWGVAHRTYVALLVFVPVFGWFIMPFVLGAKGNDWAWRNREWQSVEQFRRAQRSWGLGGLLAWVGAFIFAALAGGIALYTLQHSRAFELASAELQADSRVQDMLGRPLEFGAVSGSVNTVGGAGDAQLEFPIRGPKAHATAYVIANQRAGEWVVERMDVQLESGPRLVLERTPTAAQPPPIAAAPPPPRPAARVQLTRGVTEMHGDLPRKRVEQTIDAALGRLEPCFQPQGLQRPVQLKIRSIISPTGAVQTAQLVEASTPSTPYAYCITNEVRSWTFPPPKGGGIVVLSYVLNADPS